jgi:WS/DGAT/MGAT family acyltransferase
MSDFAYERLTEMDRSFLIAEGPNSPMHVGAVQILEGDPLRDATGAIDFERILAYVASRLHRIPRYRQRVVPAPLDGHPIWVDDAGFELRYHVRHSRLPRPGSERVLKRTCARILERPLDLAKPPWELWLVEGLENGRVALVNKTHHCMIDGVAGADLLSALMAPVPCAAVDPPPVWLPQRGPTAGEYAATELAARFAASMTAARSIATVVTDDRARAELAERLDAVARVVGSVFGGVTSTPFNEPIGPHRRFDWLQVSFEDVALIRQRFGGTLNDVVLSVVAGAVRRFLERSRRTAPDGIDFRVMAPVSVRDPRERGQLGNHVAGWLVPIPIDERDPVARLARVRQATDRLKQRHDALAIETLSLVVVWVGAAPIAMGARLLEHAQPPFHMVVTNVPGPRAPLYLLGARMLEAHPMAPLLGHLALGVAVFSFVGKLSWGFLGDWDGVPDLHEFVLDVRHAFDALLACAREAPERVVAIGDAAAARSRRSARGRARDAELDAVSTAARRAPTESPREPRRTDRRRTR